MKKQHVKIQLAIWTSLLLVCVTGCYEKKETILEVPEYVTMQAPPEEYAEPTDEQILQDYLESMTLEEKVGQLFYVTIGNLADPEGFGTNALLSVTEAEIETLQNYHTGGIILMGENVQTDAQVASMITDLQDHSTVPLFIGVDEEGGVVSRLGNTSGISMSNVGSMQSLGEMQDVSKAYDVGETLASGLSALGFNMDFAPVADVLTNPNNYEIGSRSFGSDPAMVSDMVAAEIQGLHVYDICTTAKHFPGHGGVYGNSHQNLQYVDTSVQDLRMEEFLPFQAAIDADTDFILVSHLVLTHLEQDMPSTLSKNVVTGLLREELGYEGVVITDSFQMGSITENYSQEEAAVAAIQAGCDMILMPLVYMDCYQGIIDAVENGEISEQQIDDACMRVLRIKMKRGILTVE